MKKVPKPDHQPIINEGRWTKEEHKRFLEGIEMYGRKWKKISKQVITRTSDQCRSHGQKYFISLEKGCRVKSLLYDKTYEKKPKESDMDTTLPKTISRGVQFDGDHRYLLDLGK